MTNISNPVRCLVSFTIDMTNTPVMKLTKERLNISNNHCNLPRRSPNIIDTVYDKQIISFNLEIIEI